MRTQQEIVARIRKRRDLDPYGFEWQIYLVYLDYAHAKEFLKDYDITEEQWAKVRGHLDHTQLRQEMIDYMPFAWLKANGFRGLSAWRSLAHYVAWLWLEDAWPEEEVDNLLDYEYYGKDHLRKICEHLGLDPDQWDDGVRKNLEDYDED